MNLHDLVDRLAAHKTLGAAPREELEWLASHGALRDLAEGDVLTRKGVPVEGLFVGLAGIIIASRMNSAQPGLGVGYELDAIAAAVIGGTSLSGGEGSIVGTVIGAFLISTLRIGLSVAGVPDQWKSVITGLVVIGAVFLDILRRRAQA